MMTQRKAWLVIEDEPCSLVQFDVHVHVHASGPPDFHVLFDVRRV